jgi:hypothetical protein
MSSGQQNTNVAIAATSKGIAIFGGDQGAADEGSFFVVTNPAPGTAIATTTSVVDDATGATTRAQQKPVMVLTNGWTSSSGVLAQNIYLRYLKMFIVQVPTSATSWKYAMRLSPGITTKVTTAGTSCVPVSPNGNYAQASRAVVSFGAITCTDSTTDTGQRLVANGQISGAIPVALDEWLFTFGDGSKSIDSIGTQTLVKRLTIPVPPIVVPPGWTWTLEMWGASNAAAPSWEFEMGYVERPTGQ